VPDLVKIIYDHGILVVGALIHATLLIHNCLRPKVIVDIRIVINEVSLVLALLSACCRNFSVS